MNMVEKIINWLVVSSADPEKTSLTIKGMFLTYTSFAILAAQYAHITLTENQYVTYVGIGVAILGGILSVFGIGRKIYFEIVSLLKRSNLG